MLPLCNDATYYLCPPKQFGDGAIEGFFSHSSKVFAWIDKVCMLGLHIQLVADEDYHHVRIAVLPHLLQPHYDVFEGVPARYVIHQQSTTRPSVVSLAPRDAAECLLASCNDGQMGCCHDMCVQQYK